MLDTLAELPFWQAFVALFVIVMLRSNATYWVGRGAIAGWHRSRGRQGAVEVRAEKLLNRLGPVAVTLSYLTIGIQTAVHFTAGFMRMALAWYLPAAIIGSALWAALYATVGLAVVQAWAAAQAGSSGGIAALVLIVTGAAVAWVLTRRRAREHTPPAGEVADDGMPSG